MTHWNSEDCEQDYTPGDDPTEWEQEAWEYLEWRAEQDDDIIPF